MGQALVGRATFIAVAGFSVFISAAADAGPRLGPAAVLGLATLPLRMMTQGVVPHGLGVLRSHRHAARAPEPAIPVPVPAPTAHVDPNADPNPPGRPAAVEARAEPVPTLEARAEPVPAVEPPRPAPPPPALPPPPWPTASPSVYEDLLGYVLWPGDYADRLWAHGYGDIMNTLLNTFLAPAAVNADQAASMVQDGMCSAKARELADQLIARSGELIGPAPDQKAALDELGSALGEAIDRGRAAVCAGTGDPLKRMEDGLWIMWDATLLMRAPLEKFYDALTDAQKAKLTGGAAASQALARACSGQSGSGDRIEQVLRARAQGADPQQRLMLETLRRQSAELIRFLAISCPMETRASPMDRLAAAGGRMNALLYVAMSMSPALAELHQMPLSRP
jgi:hypothetical protein